MNYLDSHIPIEPVLGDDLDNLNNSDIARRSTAPTIFDGSNSGLVYAAPNTVRIQLTIKIYYLFL
jgi:hypothetical protein